VKQERKRGTSSNARNNGNEDLEVARSIRDIEIRGDDEKGIAKNDFAG